MRQPARTLGQEIETMSTPPASPTNPTGASDTLLLEKADQVPAILAEMGVDAWLIFVRESEAMHDPSLDTVVGSNVTWQSAFLFSATGARTAMVGSLDVHRVKSAGVFCRTRGDRPVPGRMHQNRPGKEQGTPLPIGVGPRRRHPSPPAGRTHRRATPKRTVPTRQVRAPEQGLVHRRR